MKKIAVYGSLRKDFGNHRLIEDCKYIGTTKIDFPGIMVSLGGFPGLIRTEEEINSIVVEIYKVDDDTLTSVNRLEGCVEPDKPSIHNFYNRSVAKTEFGEVYYYELANPDTYRKDYIVKSGDWYEYRKQESEQVLS